MAVAARHLARDLRPVRDRAALDAAAAKVRPVTLAEDRLLPVIGALEPVLPDGGLRRGTTVAVTGSASLALALLAGPSAAGSWVAAVGWPELAMAAAHEHGIALERCALVPDPGDQWLAVVGALLDGVDVVVTVPPRLLRPPAVRQLMNRTRERGAVLISAGAWDGADVRLTVTDRQWHGLGAGHGHVEGATFEVTTSGRGTAAHERRHSLSLPFAVGETKGGD